MKKKVWFFIGYAYILGDTFEDMVNISIQIIVFI